MNLPRGELPNLFHHRVEVWCADMGELADEGLEVAQPVFGHLQHRPLLSAHRHTAVVLNMLPLIPSRLHVLSPPRARQAVCGGSVIIEMIDRAVIGRIDSTQPPRLAPRRTDARRRTSAWLLPRFGRGAWWAADESGATELGDVVVEAQLYQPRLVRLQVPVALKLVSRLVGHSHGRKQVVAMVSRAARVALPTDPNIQYYSSTLGRLRQSAWRHGISVAR